jgi:dienelactone hydrolase
MRWSIRAALIGAALALLYPGGALAATSAGQPFPSDLYTQRDTTQVTHLRVDLPTPNCTTHPSDCADIAVLNTLDGFNIQPRISVPFSGPIKLSTVSSSTVFLVGEHHEVVGINQIEWEPAVNTLHFESDQQLAQDETYVLVVTQGVQDADGHPLAPLVLTHNPHDRYANALEDALPDVLAGPAGPVGVAALSIFTTQSIDATSKRIRNQLHDGRLSFALGTNGERTVFPLSSTTGISLRRQNGTATFALSDLPLAALQIYPGSVSAVAFGSYSSPDYENADEVIPLAGTRVGVPAVQSINQLGFTLFIPSGPKPSGGWPVAIFGHGFTDSKDGAPWAVASSLAHAGIATIAINVVGHGGGALGTYTVTRTDGSSVTLPSGGRGIDQDHNGMIDSTEGVSAIGALQLVGNRDGLRQTVIDLMQLVRDLKHGVDIDGDHHDDLSSSRIYYAGQSFGGIYGVQLLGLEPDIRAGVPNVAGGSIIEVARLGGFRILVGIALLTRTPPLYNAVPNPPFYTSFNENMPLRNLAPVVDTVPGASAIQSLLDQTEWAQQSANPAAYAPFIDTPVIMQFARGDMTVPNPTTSAILRAGGLASRATLFRNDLAHADFGTSTNPHTFLTNITGAGALFAIEAQAQIATFFASDGATTIDPDGPGKYFETPTSIVPEDLGFIH